MTLIKLEIDINGLMIEATLDLEEGRAQMIELNPADIKETNPEEFAKLRTLFSHVAQCNHEIGEIQRIEIIKYG